MSMKKYTRILQLGVKKFPDVSKKKIPKDFPPQYRKALFKEDLIEPKAGEYWFVKDRKQKEIQKKLTIILKDLIKQKNLEQSDEIIFKDSEKEYVATVQCLELVEQDYGLKDRKYDVSKITNKLVKSLDEWELTPITPHPKD